ncbi:MAG: hypothetical protein ACHQAZ_04110 [Gammaproteobacteria bacterium]
MKRSPQIAPGNRLLRALGALRPVGVLGLLCLPLAWSNPAWAQDAPPKYPSTPPVAQYLIADQASEIALARTAAAKSVSDNASILVLGKDGYVTAVQGSNGFTCYVGRSWEKDFDDPEFFNPHGRTPQCWNAAATSSVLPDILKRAQWVLAGVSRDEMAARTKAEVAAHEVSTPAPGSMVFMLSKEQYINDPVPGPGGESNWLPHVMFFMPAAAPADGSAWGANMHGSPIFSTTSDVEPITTYFVLAPKWSDGTLSPADVVSTPKPDEQHHH